MSADDERRNIGDRGCATPSRVFGDSPDALDPLQMSRDDVDRLVQREGAEGAAKIIATRATERLRSVKVVVETGSAGSRARLARHDHEVEFADEERARRQRGAMGLHERLQQEQRWRDPAIRVIGRDRYGDPVLTQPRDKHEVKREDALVQARMDRHGVAVARVLTADPLAVSDEEGEPS